jgi:hypothetical protein
MTKSSDPCDAYLAGKTLNDIDNEIVKQQKVGPQDQNRLHQKAADAAKADKYIRRDGGAPIPDVSELGNIEYGQTRKDLAETLGIPVAFLDKERAARLKHAAVRAESPLSLHEPELWADPVNGAELLDKIRDVALDHLVLPNGSARVELFPTCAER